MNKIPAWFNEIKRFCTTKSVFLLSGNIRDYFPFYRENSPEGGFPIPYKIKDFLKEMLSKEGYNAFVLYDPIDGFSSLQGAEDIIRSFAKGRRPDEAIVSIREMLRAVKDRHLVVIFDYSSRVVSDPSHLSGTELRFFTVVEKISHEGTPFILDEEEGKPPLCNLLIMLLQKENDFPPWLSYNNPGIKSIVIPKPHAGLREEMALSFINIFPGASGLSPSEKEEAVKKLASLTEKMLLLDMQAIGLLARKEGIDVRRLEEAVRRYKTGIQEDPWQYLQEKIKEEAKEVLNRHIKGQDHVKKKVLEILSRTTLGLSGAHLGQNIHRPKGVFFFAGPTGVGKTQTAKAIADIVFSDPNALVRFDMSEFSEPHTDQRLIGAPPGYVGYQQGGELTNAVRENPFTLLLFDEIEKAHPKILDIFLQILDDGRLTDAKGETVYFSEAIIVFTTNLGVYKYDEKTGKKVPLVSPEDDFQKVEKNILEYIENYFRFVLARPELFNRIGRSNIIVFDFIREDVAKQIFEKFLKTFLSNVERLHGIKINLSPQTREKLMKACTSDLTYGGRGIAQAFEAYVIGELLEAIKEAKDKGLKEIEI